MADDLRVPLGPLYDAFGVPATVTRPAPDDTPIETSGIWLSAVSDDVPVGTAFQRREPQRVMAFMRAAVPTIPRGTVVVAPEVLGGIEATWRVDGLERVDAEEHRVYLVLQPDVVT